MNEISIDYSTDQIDNDYYLTGYRNAELAIYNNNHYLTVVSYPGNNAITPGCILQPSYHINAMESYLLSIVAEKINADSRPFVYTGLPQTERVYINEYNNYEVIINNSIDADIQPGVLLGGSQYYLETGVKIYSMKLRRLYDEKYMKLFGDEIIQSDKLFVDPEGAGITFKAGIVVSSINDNILIIYGPTGPQGPTGPVGSIGLNGPTGPTGPVGMTGAIGDVGSTGITGTNSYDGYTGIIGAVGPTGAFSGNVINNVDYAGWGITGLQSAVINNISLQCSNNQLLADSFVILTINNYTEIVGDIKYKGPIGHSGPTGPDGLIGPTGMIGPTGIIGPTGATGPTGPDGQLGPTGPVGPQGPTGSAGLRGRTGSVGGIGLLGLTGMTGPAGPTGPRGAMGAAGSTGPTGPTGPVGSIGPTGLIGPLGPVGSVGPMGPTGSNGPQGSGPAGPAGPIGPDGQGNGASLAKQRDNKEIMYGWSTFCGTPIILAYCYYLDIIPQSYDIGVLPLTYNIEGTLLIYGSQFMDGPNYPYVSYIETIDTFYKRLVAFGDGYVDWSGSVLGYIAYIYDNNVNFTLEIRNKSGTISNIADFSFYTPTTTKIIVDGAYILFINDFVITPVYYVKNTSIIQLPPLTVAFNSQDISYNYILNATTKIIYFTNSQISTSSYIINGYTSDISFKLLTPTNGASLWDNIPAPVQFAIYDGNSVWACTSTYLYQITFPTTSTYTVIPKISIQDQYNMVYYNKKIFILTKPGNICCYNILTNSIEIQSTAYLGYSTPLTWIFLYDCHILTRMGNNLYKIA